MCKYDHTYKFPRIFGNVLFGLIPPTEFLPKVSLSKNCIVFKKSFKEIRVKHRNLKRKLLNWKGPPPSIWKHSTNMRNGGNLYV